MWEPHWLRDSAVSPCASNRPMGGSCGPQRGGLSAPTGVISLVRAFTLLSASSTGRREPFSDCYLSHRIAFNGASVVNKVKTCTIHLKLLWFSAYSKDRIPEHSTLHPNSKLTNKILPPYFANTTKNNGIQTPKGCAHLLPSMPMFRSSRATSTLLLLRILYRGSNTECHIDTADPSK